MYVLAKKVFTQVYGSTPYYSIFSNKGQVKVLQQCFDFPCEHVIHTTVCS